MKKKSPGLQLTIEMIQIIIGSVIYAAGIQWFFSPVSMVSGGITGISMIINMLWKIPTGVMILIFNVPIFIFAFRRYGLKFMLTSLIGMAVSAVAIDIFSLWDIKATSDPFLAAIFGGLVCGIGLGMVYYTGATTGGMDIVAKLIREKKPYINFGSFVLALDAVVIALYAIVFRRFDNAMYTVIAVYIYTRIIDLMLYGSSQCKLCHIISERSDEIKSEIVKSLRRGVTVIQGKGAYSGQDKQILLCVVKRQQIVEIRHIVKSIDTSAFVIVSDTRDVFGSGFSNINVEK